MQTNLQVKMFLLEIVAKKYWKHALLYMRIEKNYINLYFLCIWSVRSVYNFKIKRKYVIFSTPGD